MADRNARSEWNVGDTDDGAAEVEADNAELKGHLAFEGDRDAMRTVDALRAQGAQLGEGSEDDTARPDPAFRQKLRGTLVNRGTEGSDDTAED